MNSFIQQWGAGFCSFNAESPPYAWSAPNVTSEAAIYYGTANYSGDYAGTGTSPLEFRRIYDSGLQFGQTWRTNYSRWITYFYAAGASTATINRPEGSFTFTQSGSAWVPDGDVNYTLAGSGGAFTVTTPDGREIERYRGDGQLQSVSSPSGSVKYTLTYNTSTPALLTQISDAFGHSLTLTYDGQGRLAIMTDPNGGVYQYGYDANNNLSTVTYPDGTRPIGALSKRPAAINRALGCARPCRRPNHSTLTEMWCRRQISTEM